MESSIGFVKCATAAFLSDRMSTGITSPGLLNLRFPFRLYQSSSERFAASDVLLLPCWHSYRLVHFFFPLREAASSLSVWSCFSSFRSFFFKRPVANISSPAASCWLQHFL